MSRVQRRARVAGGDPRAQTKIQSEHKTATGRPELQGNGNARAACQPPPRWTAPQGWDALEILARHWPEPHL